MVEAHVWNEKLDLGNDAMDQEHHLQIGLVSALAEAVEQRRPSMARRLVEHLARYSTVHFGSEELLMDARVIAVPERAKHAAEHASLMQRIDELDHALAEGDDDVALATALDLRAAFAAHIVDSDRSLAAQARTGART